MIRGYGAGQIRAAERPLLEAGVPLMARAAAGLAAVCLDELRDMAGGDPRSGTAVYGSGVVLLVGTGNNGGDALFAGARLAARGARVTALLIGSGAHAEGLAALHRAGGRSLLLAEAGREAAAGLMAGARLLVDGVLGTGARPGLPDGVAELLARWSELRRGVPGDGGSNAGRRQRVIAVDVPSGPEIPADVTVTFAARKTSLLLSPHGAGRVVVVDIGLPLPEAEELRSLGAEDISRFWPVPGPTDHKYTRGLLGLVAGSERYPGAAVLSAVAAVETGVGMLRYVGPQAPRRLIVERCPEMVPGRGRVQAWSLGSGIGADDEERQAALRVSLADARENGLPCVFDAGALALIEDGGPGVPAVLTPHAGELETLLGRLGGGSDAPSRPEIESEPLRWARRAAELTGSVVLLKGSVTVIAAPGGGPAYAQGPATPWLATAGAGDVLAGIAGALVATSGARMPGELARCAALAVLVHSLAAAAASAGGPLRAPRIAEHIAPVVAAAIGDGAPPSPSATRN